MRALKVHVLVAVVRYRRIKARGAVPGYRRNLIAAGAVKVIVRVALSVRVGGVAGAQMEHVKQLRHARRCSAGQQGGKREFGCPRKYCRPGIQKLCRIGSLYQVVASLRHRVESAAGARVEFETGNFCGRVAAVIRSGSEDSADSENSAEVDDPEQDQQQHGEDNRRLDHGDCRLRRNHSSERAPDSAQVGWLCKFHHFKLRLRPGQCSCSQSDYCSKCRILQETSRHHLNYFMLVWRLAIEGCASNCKDVNPELNLGKPSGYLKL